MIEFLQEYLRFNTQGSLYIASGIFDITVGLIALRRDPKSSINRSFFLITLSGFVWVFSYGMMSLVRSENHAYFWMALSYLGVPSICYSIYLFSLSILEQLKFNSNVRFGLFASSLFSFLMLFFTRDLCTIQTYHWGRFNLFNETNYGLFFFYGITSYFFYFLYLSALNFYQYWKQSTHPLKKSQARIIFLGFVLSYFGTIDFLVTRGLKIYPIGFLALTYLIAMMAYTIVRHKFFEINVLFKKITLLVLIYSFLLAFSIPTAFMFLETYFPNLNNRQLLLFLGFGAVFGTILSMGPIIYAFLVQHSYWLRGHVTTGLTHELKSPLGIIESAVTVAIDELSEPNLNKSKISEYLSLIQNNTTRLQNFVRDLLTVAKTSDEEITLQKETVQLEEVVRTVFDVQRPVATQKSITLVFDQDINVAVTADPAKVRQIISNLVSNAIKFSDSGSIIFSIHKSKYEVLCTIKDNGIGIENKFLTKIFDRFFQARPGLKGSGIGLSIAKTWVEAHGGKIWAESEGEGKGTTMRFTLPL